MSLEFDNVTFSFGEKVFFRDFNLEVRPGERVAVYGVGNYGKSFLLRMALGLLKPDTGTITALGSDVATLDGDDAYEYRRRMGFVSRDSDLIHNLSVLSNIALSLDFHTRLSRKEISLRVVRLLEDLGIARYRDAFPAELDEDIKKKTALARAVIAMPDIMLIDECAYGYDDITSRSIVKLFFEVIKKHDPERKQALLLTTRQMPLYTRYVDRIAVVDDTRIIFTGTPAEYEACSDEQVVRLRDGVNRPMI